MWPFKRRAAPHDGERSSEPPKVSTEPPPWPRLANHETYGQFVNDDVALTLMVGTFNHAIMRPRGNANVRMPAIALSVPPGSGFDFADPEYGFGGWVEPPSERVLRLWADDLLTISHGKAWRFVVAGDEPFDREWVETMFPPSPSGDDFIPERALVIVQFGDTPEGDYAATDLDALPTTLTYIEDRRQG